MSLSSRTCIAGESSLLGFLADSIPLSCLELENQAKNLCGRLVTRLEILRSHLVLPQNDKVTELLVIRAKFLHNAWNDKLISLAGG